MSTSKSAISSRNQAPKSNPFAKDAQTKVHAFESLVDPLMTLSLKFLSAISPQQIHDCVVLYKKSASSSNSSKKQRSSD